MNLKPKKNTALQEWRERCNSGLEKCSCGETRHLSVDHIVPVYLLLQFGLDKYEVAYNMEENFDIKCRYCNMKKGGEIDVKNPKTYEIIEKVLKEAKEYYLTQHQT